MATKITNVGSRQCETLTIRPTAEWALIPVTRPNGRTGYIRRQIYTSDSGRFFILDGGEFAEVRRTAFGGYRLADARFIEGEWHYDDNGVLVAGPEETRRMPIFVPTATPKKEDESWMSFC